MDLPAVPTGRLRTTAPQRWAAIAVDVAPLAALGLVLALDDRPTSSRLVQATVLLVIVPLAARRWWPLAVLAVVAFGAVVTSADTRVPIVQVVAVALASFSLGERSADRARSALAVVAIAGLMTIGFIAQDGDVVESTVLPFVVVVPSWLIGDVVAGRRLEAARRAVEMERTLREGAERMRAAAAEERRHVARELHDVVAHAVSVMVIQAGAARQVVRSAPDRAEESLLAVESTGREAMAELRAFLGALSVADETAGLAPQPGLAEVPALVERVREAGLPATLEVRGAARPVPAAVDVTAYRILQEALTNALRHAGRAVTLVSLSWDADQLRLEVLDDGPGSAPAEAAAAASTAPVSGPGLGRGIVGMTERASLVGGRLEAGTRVGGGYAVRAWLPIAPPRPADSAPDVG